MSGKGTWVSEAEDERRRILYERLLDACDAKDRRINSLSAQVALLKEEKEQLKEELQAVKAAGKGKGQDGKGKDKEERYFMREEEKFAEMVRKGKDKGKGKDGDDRCEHCGSLLRIPWTPASQGKGSSSSAARSRSPRPAWCAAAFPPSPQTPPE